MGVRAIRAASVAVLTLVALGLATSPSAAAPQTLCKSTDARGTVTYSDCAPPTTYRPDDRRPSPLPDDTPPTPAAQAPAPPPPAKTPWGSVTSAPSTTWQPANAARPAMAAIGAFRPAFTGQRLWLVGGVALVIVGLGINVVTSIQYLIRAFGVGVWWGLGCLFVAPVNLLFVILHWRLVQKPVLLSLLGTALMVVGVVIAKGL